MPRFPVVATAAERIAILALVGPQAPGTLQADAVAVLERASCRSSVSGKGMWRRLDIVSEGPPARSYTVVFNVLFGSRRRIHQLLRALSAET
jgi:hypothetical protein